jgi:hypothetical protein
MGIPTDDDDGETDHELDDAADWLTWLTVAGSLVWLLAGAALAVWLAQ